MAWNWRSISLFLIEWGTILNKIAGNKEKNLNNSFSDEEDELEDEAQELPEVNTARKSKFRTSVSAEVYG